MTDKMILANRQIGVDIRAAGIVLLALLLLVVTQANVWL